jgi:ABC-type proline/glycine betaine transport system permease subunit/ABC-type proline/glycine betaine transport system substrate-binding protein
MIDSIMKFKQVLKSSLKTILILLLVSLVACQPLPDSYKNTNNIASQVKLRTAHSNWIEEHFQTEIVKIGLEKLGYQVEPPKEIDYPAIYLSLANGDLDYSVVYYTPVHQAFFNNAGGRSKLAEVGFLTPDGVQGYQIDKKTADQYNITNLEQLKDPNIAKLFDSDGDGLANLVGCNAGWACELIIDHHLEAYGLKDTVEQDRGQYTPLLANSLARYKQGKPVIFYAYNPHWINAILKLDQDVVWLEVPFTSLPNRAASDISEKETSVKGKNLGFPKTTQRILANKKFLAEHPIAKRWFELVQIPAEDINQESLRIKEGENTPEDIRRHAQEWVTLNQDLFNTWIEKTKSNTNEIEKFPATKITKERTIIDNILNPFQLYKIPLEKWTNQIINLIVDNFRPLFQAIGFPVGWTLKGIEGIFLAIPPLILIIIMGLLAWQVAGKKIALYTIISLIMIGFVDVWEQAMVSLSLVVTAILFCLIFGIPIGIISAKNNRFDRLIRPLLDVMQTLPSFVYLVPVVMLFGIGAVPGIIATIIFAMPPLIRLTNLGIRQVSPEVIEAAIAFGATPLQVLWEAQLPLALPTILAGVNQAILMALSMSVVTSMIAVPGLGQMVLQGVGRLNVGLAAVGGLGIVLLAIMLDRITQAIANPEQSRF